MDAWPPGATESAGGAGGSAPRTPGWSTLAAPLSPLFHLLAQPLDLAVAEPGQLPGQAGGNLDQAAHQEVAVGRPKALREQERAGRLRHRLQLVPGQVAPGPAPRPRVRAAVEQRFAQVARSPGQETKFPVGPASAKKLGYDPKEIDTLPLLVTESFCGVGNPLGLGEVGPGQTVLDLGSGPGLDSFLAARRVGPTGRVVGVDLCPQMVEKARCNAALLGLRNAEFLHAGIENLPLPDASVDVVISNGVFNLCPDKPGVLAEVFRVLRPGGRLQMADILLHEDVTPEEVASKGEWSD